LLENRFGTEQKLFVVGDLKIKFTVGNFGFDFVCAFARYRRNFVQSQPFRFFAAFFTEVSKMCLRGFAPQSYALKFSRGNKKLFPYAHFLGYNPFSEPL
jgi:hypothetical protein